MAPRILDHTGRPFQDDPQHLADGFAVPRALTFNALIGSTRAYFADRWDEAMRKSRQDALKMRHETYLMSLMQERYLAVASLPWHLEVPDEKDPVQAGVRDLMAESVRSGKRLTTMIYCLLEAVWYGRFGVQCDWLWRYIKGKKVLSVRRWTPENGDLIGHLKDGTPYIAVHPSESHRLKDAEFTTTTNGARGLVLRGTWRDRFLLHTHVPESPDYFDAVEAEALFGLGVRSRVFYYEFIKNRWLGQICSFIERVGLGVNLWYFSAGDKVSEDAIRKAAHDYGNKLNILVPRWQGSKGDQPGMERVEVPTAGADLMLRLFEHVEQIEERFIIGQSMSSGRDNKDGLGGTGRAEFARDTKEQVRNFDAVNLAESALTGDQDDPGLCWIMQRFSFPETMPGRPNGFQVRFKFDLEDSKSKEKLDAGKVLVDMGVDIKADEARSAAGFSKPGEGDEVVEGRQAPDPAQTLLGQQDQESDSGGKKPPRPPRTKADDEPDAGRQPGKPPGKPPQSGFNGPHGTNGRNGPPAFNR